MTMNRGKFGQARCSACGSWHFAIQLDEKGNIESFKCCREICGRIIPYHPNMLINIKGKKGDVK